MSVIFSVQRLCNRWSGPLFSGLLIEKPKRGDPYYYANVFKTEVDHYTLNGQRHEITGGPLPMNAIQVQGRRDTPLNQPAQYILALLKEYDGLSVLAKSKDWMIPDRFKQVERRVSRIQTIANRLNSPGQTDETLNEIDSLSEVVLRAIADISTREFKTIYPYNQRIQEALKQLSGVITQIKPKEPLEELDRLNREAKTLMEEMDTQSRVWLLLQDILIVVPLLSETLVLAGSDRLQVRTALQRRVADGRPLSVQVVPPEGEDPGYTRIGIPSPFPRDYPKGHVPENAQIRLLV